MILTNCTAETQFANLERLYLKTFPESERKPFSLMLQKSREGIMELLAIEEETGAFLGLAITILYKDLVLLDYFAVSPTMQGQNIGSRALRLLQERYTGKRFFLEIEDPREHAPNQEERIRRKAFYLRNNMTVMPYYVKLFGVPMQIMTNGTEISYEEYHEIYRESFSREISSKIKKY